MTLMNCIWLFWLISFNFVAVQAIEIPSYQRIANQWHRINKTLHYEYSEQDHRNPWHTFDRPMQAKESLVLREQTREMFYHGFMNYMTFAYPEDEIKPLTCGPMRRDPRASAYGINDVLGDYLLTLVDSMDTLAILGDEQGFHDAVRKVIRQLRFNHNHLVQVFEATIRILGGLLSSHLLLTSNPFDIESAVGLFQMPGYKNQLLWLAVDLADRLMPAFQSPTGIPYARVNLLFGVPPRETTQTCLAGAGSLILEFGLLSRLSGDPKYESAARKALFAMYQKRSSLGLYGNDFDALSGKWVTPYSHIGAGLDSFYEYLLKAAILFQDDDYLKMFDEALSAVQGFMREKEASVYRVVHMDNGEFLTGWIDSLGAFFPGLLVLYGQLNEATQLHALYACIWRRYGAMPERFDISQNQVIFANYPLRPELAESTYFMYLATRNDFYLRVGEMILHDLNKKTRTRCGFASIEDVNTLQLSDRMESFFLSETLKYLFLLFDAHVNPQTKWHSAMSFVYSTEAHPLWLPRNTKLSQNAKISFSLPLHQCETRSKSLQSHLATKSWLQTVYNYFVRSNHATPSSDSSHLTPVQVQLGKPPCPSTPRFLQSLQGDVLLNTLCGSNLSFDVIEDSNLKATVYSCIQWNEFKSVKRIFVLEAYLNEIGVGSNAVKVQEDEDWQVFEQRRYSMGTLWVNEPGLSLTRIPLIAAVFGQEWLHDPNTAPSRLVYIDNDGWRHGCDITETMPNYGKVRQQVYGQILLLERGDCLFSHKLKTVRSLNPVAVVIANNSRKPLIQMHPGELDVTGDMQRLMPSFSMAKQHFDVLVMHCRAVFPMPLCSLNVQLEAGSSAPLSKLDLDVFLGDEPHDVSLSFNNRAVENIVNLQWTRKLFDAILDGES